MLGELEFEKELLEKVDIDKSIEYLDRAIKDIRAGKFSRIALIGLAEDALYHMSFILKMMKEENKELTPEYVALYNDSNLWKFYDDITYFNEVEAEEIAKYENESSK